MRRGKRSQRSVGEKKKKKSEKSSREEEKEVRKELLRRGKRSQ